MGFMVQVLIVFTRLMSTNSISNDKALIIGDTKFDLIGGQTIGIKTMAVTWGFGELDDLLLYSPDYICHTPLEILSTLKNRFTNL